MPRKKASKQLISNWTKDSIEKYQDTDPVKRIWNAYRISQDAANFVKTDNADEEDVMKALIKITRDQSEARRLRRLHELCETSIIHKAVKHLETIAPNKKNYQTNGTNGPKSERRLPDADRVVRTAGISRTHLLTLASVEHEDTRDRLFRESIENGWSSSELKRQARGSAKIQIPIRPTDLSYSTLVKATELLELLQRVARPEMVEATTTVKPSEQKRTIEQCTAAIRKLLQLERQIGPTIKTLKEVQRRLKKQA